MSNNTVCGFSNDFKMLFSMDDVIPKIPMIQIFTNEKSFTMIFINHHNYSYGSSARFLVARILSEHFFVWVSFRKSRDVNLYKSQNHHEEKTIQFTDLGCFIYLSVDVKYS